MNKTELYKCYFKILESELIPASGCTEPIAIAYASAVARQHLGKLPDKIIVKVSGNLVKNAKSVTIPNTNGLTGIAVAVSAGIIAGDPEKKLEVISEISQKDREEIAKYSNSVDIDIDILDEGKLLDFIIIIYSGNQYVKVRLSDTHTNIVYIEKNNEILFFKKEESNDDQSDQDRQYLNIDDIYDFAKNADLRMLKDTLQLQIDYNMAIAYLGMKNPQGAAVGPTILKNEDNGARTNAKAMAASASDARMAGVNMPVVIAAGSGNQGISASVPVITYGREMGKTEEEIIRALAFSDLAAIHQKTKIGKLSAYCGAVCAATASVAGIAFLEKQNIETIATLITNSLAISSGIICDGAKASCAAKIASSIETAFLSYDMAKNEKAFKDGEGIVSSNIEKTISNVGRLAKDGMQDTDIEIVNIMIGK